MAEDTMTPAAELERLLGRSAAMNQRLARHPNLPLNLYRSLAQLHPEAAWANLAIGRLIAEDSELLHTRPKLLDQPQCPTLHIRWAAAHGTRWRRPMSGQRDMHRLGGLIVKFPLVNRCAIYQSLLLLVKWGCPYMNASRIASSPRRHFPLGSPSALAGIEEPLTMYKT